MIAGFLMMRVDHCQLIAVGPCLFWDYELKELAVSVVWNKGRRGNQVGTKSP